MLVTTINLDLSPDQQNLYYLTEITHHALDYDSIMTFLRDIASYKQRWIERYENCRKLFLAFYVLTVIINFILLAVFPELQKHPIEGILVFTIINLGAYFVMIKFLKKNGRKAKRGLDRIIAEENEQIRHTGFFWASPSCFFAQIELHRDSAYMPPVV